MFIFIKQIKMFRTIESKIPLVNDNFHPHVLNLILCIVSVCRRGLVFCERENVKGDRDEEMTEQGIFTGSNVGYYVMEVGVISIPIPSKYEYTLILLNMTEDFLTSVGTLFSKLFLRFLLSTRIGIKKQLNLY